MKLFILISIFSMASLSFCNAQNKSSKTLYGYEKTQTNKAYGLLETVHSKAMN